MTISNDPPSEAQATNGDGTTSSKSSKCVPVWERPLYKPRPLRVVCIGAGYSGLMIAYKYKYQTPMDDFVDLTIYEKNDDVGGTWYENRYPGVACDVPAHIYTFLWEPNPDWSSFYASGSEIWEYIKRTTVKYNLDEKVQLNSKVVSAVWDDDKGKWRLKIEQNGTVIEDEADVLINGSGILNNWRWPDIPGLHSFKGQLLHSARWDPALDWAGKRVGLIGNGSSAIQILPRLQATAARVVNYVRSPTWISAPYSADLTPEGKNFQYSEAEKQKLRDHPDELFKLRKTIENHFNQFFYALLDGTPQQQAATEAFTARMREALGNDPELCAKLIPAFKVGCRRLTPGEGYLEALQAPNVELVFGDAIARVTPQGVETAGGRRDDLDVLVCATGFDVSFVPPFEVVGRGGVRLADKWGRGGGGGVPAAYFGVCVPDLPNYFVFNGPNSPVGHGSLLAVMEWMAEYVLRWCRKIAAEDIKSVAVSGAAAAEYNAYSNEFLRRTAWTSGCRSWYKGNREDGPVTAMYAGSILHYKEILESFRTEDFCCQYNSANRFRFMGNGMTTREDGGGDLAFYVYK